MIAAENLGTTLDWTDFTKDEFNQYLESLGNKYEGIFDYYTKFVINSPKPNDYQHQQLAQYYRDVIKQALSNFDPSLRNEEKEALSWIGLNKADIVAWQNLTPNERTAINNIQTQITNTSTNGCD